MDSIEDSARLVLDLLQRGSYEVDGVEVSIAESQRAAVSGSRLYAPDELDDMRRRVSDGPRPRVEVTDATSQQAARELAGAGRVALLNFASARNPGGGFLNGAKAQEEDLCRCSGLYPTLLEHPKYYEANRARRSLLYTDYAIFSPDVPFFRAHGAGEWLADPYRVSVITAPAPNTGPYLRASGDPSVLAGCFERRWANVLAIAREQEIPTVLLGAWGCGAFQGEPKMASATAERAISTYGPAFDRIVFAIPGTGKRSARNLEVFRAAFGSDADR